MYKKFNNPLIERYASEEMAYIFSPEKKFGTWRKLWIALAEAERKLGLNITEEQINELRKYQSDLNIDRAKEIERETRHDVMSHVKAYGEQCENAKGIIHLGATSCYVGDNTDILVMKEALDLIKKRLVNLMSNIRNFSQKHKDVPTLGFTHFQAAQLTTVGKRATLWNMDLLLDFQELEHILEGLMMRGVKGTTGTQASFLELFDGDHDKVKELDKMVVEKFGFSKTFPVTGQTYSRKVDTQVMKLLSGIAQSMHKITNDIRLLQHMKEIEEPFEKKQIGSSAMAYKRNPMRSERISSLAKYVISASSTPELTIATQWFERTLDDSANRRIVIPELFMAVDSILNIGTNVFDGMVVYHERIRRNVMSELPFMATENILMEAVKKGGDRQELHEIIREHSMESAKRVKELGKENDLIDRLKMDSNFDIDDQELDSLLDPSNFIGRAKEQVEEFNNDHINPLLEKYKYFLGGKVVLHV
ncbi:MAG: adenylosuccinate lyase [Firmicutes bacterium]|jgi:adenylosuccinate lyase|nr:adenylosuccinate lyase [Bacillota bacterium]